MTSGAGPLSGPVFHSSLWHRPCTSQCPPGPKEPSPAPRVGRPPGLLAASLPPRGTKPGPPGQQAPSSWGRDVHAAEEHSRPDASPEMSQSQLSLRVAEGGQGCPGAVPSELDTLVPHLQGWAPPLPGPSPQPYDRGPAGA